MQLSDLSTESVPYSVVSIYFELIIINLYILQLCKEISIKSFKIVIETYKLSSKLSSKHC